MKKTMMFVGFSAIFLCAYTQGVKFEQNLNWEQLKQKAKQEHKLIFLDLYATWCAPCKQMDKEVYSNDSLGDYVNQKFIAEKIQIDTSAKDNETVKNSYPFSHTISAEYQISSVPTYLFFDSDGNLLHRAEGFNPIVKFIEICEAAQDPTKSYVGMIKRYHKGELQGNELYKLAMDLKKFHQDSLAEAVAAAYKMNYLDKQNPKEILSPELLIFFSNFYKIFHAKDELIHFIYENQKSADSAMQATNYSAILVDYLITRDFIDPVFFAKEKAIGKALRFSKIQQSLTEKYDAKTAYRVVINAKCRWYKQKRDWNKFIAVWFEKLDSFPIDMKSLYGGMEVNNTVYEVVFKHSIDPTILDKSIALMETLLKVNPDDYSWLDTYSAVLYKRGRKEKAIEIEKKALSLAQRSRSQDSIDLYKKMIAKMEKGEPTWND